MNVEWLAEDKVPVRVRGKLEALLAEIAPQLNEFEAHLWDLHGLASNGLDWLMPKIELNVPIFEEGLTFRLRLVRLDETQIFLETRKGEPVAEIHVR